MKRHLSFAGKFEGYLQYVSYDEFHLAFKVDDFDAAHKLHEEMGCICFENPDMGIYFCEDPDHYWLEVLPCHNQGKDS